VNELALFAGAGGGILGGKLLGWRTVCAVENDAYAASILVARQNDGILEPFPIWDDVRTFDGTPWRGIVDVISGGFPCQDISSAGKGAGIDGSRSGLWKEMARIISEVRPSFVFVENSPLLIQRGLAVVLGDLAEMGYDAQWGVLGADDVGFAHHRKRTWLVGYSKQPRLERHPGNEQNKGERAQQNRPTSEASLRFFGWQPEVSTSDPSRIQSCKQGWKRYTKLFIEPDVGRVAHGVAKRVDRIKAIGNGQVPAVAATAFRFFMEEQGR